MTRPDIKKLSPEVVKYIEYIEQKLNDIEQDGIVGLYHSINYQLNRISRDIRNSEISIDDSDTDKYDKFWKALEKSKSIAENLDWIKQKYNLKPEDDSKKKAPNPMEELADTRR